MTAIQSRVKGISYHKGSGRFRTRIQCTNDEGLQRTITAGYFKTETEATIMRFLIERVLSDEDKLKRSTAYKQLFE